MFPLFQLIFIRMEEMTSALFYFPEGSNYAVAYTQSSIVSETITWNRENTKNNIKALVR